MQSLYKEATHQPKPKQKVQQKRIQRKRVEEEEEEKKNEAYTYLLVSFLSSSSCPHELETHSCF